MNWKSSTIDFISTTQVRWNKKRLFNSNTGVELKKINPSLKDWVNSLISRKKSFLTEERMGKENSRKFFLMCEQKQMNTLIKRVY